MEPARLGPLSYDVESASGDASAERPIVFSLLAAIAIFLVGVIGSWFLLGQVAAGDTVVLGVPIAILAGSVGVALAMSRRSLHRARRTALLASTGIGVVVALVAYQIVGSYKPALPQVRQLVDDLRLPPGFRLIFEETHGDRFCRHGCPTIQRRYAAPASDPDPVSTFVLAMFAQGWQPTSDVDPAQATIARRDGVTVQLGENEPHVVYVTAARSS